MRVKLHQLRVFTSGEHLINLNMHGLIYGLNPIRALVTLTEGIIMPVYGWILVYQTTICSSLVNNETQIKTQWGGYEKYVCKKT